MAAVQEQVHESHEAAKPKTDGRFSGCAAALALIFLLYGAIDPKGFNKHEDVLGSSPTTSGGSLS